MNEARITLTRGLPGSGKSTWAKEAATAPNTVRINRDDLRMQMFGKYWDVDEEAVSEVEMAAVRAALRLGKHVIIDAAHLKQSYVNRWQKLGYPVEIKQFHAPLDTLLDRNAQRERRVPEEVIEKMWRQHVNRDGELRHLTTRPEEFVIDYKYEQSDFKPGAIIVDIDGTLAHNDGHRSFYDYSKVLGDKPVWHVIDAAAGLGNMYLIIVVSGRSGECREDTEEWLALHGIKYDELYMRDEHDSRADTIVKMEILRDKIAPRYSVHAAIDDRPSVCEMWRKVGIPTFQVGDPDVRF